MGLFQCLSFKRKIRKVVDGFAKIAEAKRQELKDDSISRFLKK
jgi:hypothetical protein